MHICGHAGGVLAVEDGLGVARLGGLHELKLIVEVGLILRRNREVKRLCGSDLSVVLIRNRAGEFRGDGALTGLGTEDRALIAVEGHVIGARGVLDLIVFSVDAERARARHLEVIGQAVLIGNRIGTGVLDVVVNKRRVDLLLQRLLVGSNLLGVALDGHGEVVRALDIARAALHKRNRRGQRNGAIARGARHLAGVIAPAIAGRPNGVAVGALPANLELALGARAVRKREVGRNGLGRIARSVTDGNLLGGIVEHLLHTSLVPSHLNRLVGLVILGLLAIARQFKRHIGATQTVDVVTGVVVGVNEEERYIAIGLVLRIGDADRGLGVLSLKEHAALGDLNVNVGKSQISKLCLQRIIDVAALGAVVNNNLLVSIVELLDCSLERTRGDNLVGGDELDRRASARGDSLQILTSSRCRDRRLGARHIGQQRPVGRGSLRVVGRIPSNSRLTGDVDTIGGRTVSALSLHRRLDAVARNEMGRVAIDLRAGDYAQQVILPRRGNAVRRNPFNRVVESARREFDTLADEGIVERQRTGLGVNAVGDFNPIRIILALGIPSERELSVLGQIGIRPARGAGNLHARREHRANGERRRRSLVGRNGLELVLTGKRHRANGVDGLRTAVGALLLGALHRVLARGDHTNVLAHHIGRGRVRCGVGRIGNVDEVAVVGALVVGVLPLIVDRVRRGDVSVVVALGRLGRQNLACGNLARCQRALNRHTVKLNGASLDNENSTRLLVTKTAVSTCHDIFTGVGRIGCKGIGGRAIDLRRARLRCIAAVPRPRDALVGGHITRSRIGGRRDSFARIDLARLIELNARDVDGASGTNAARALSSVIAAANLCGYMATDRLALVSRELKGTRRRTFNIGVDAALDICDLPLVAQLRGIDVIGGVLLLFSKGLDGVVNGIDKGAGGGAFGGQDGGVDVHSTGLLEGTHAVAGRPTTKGYIIGARVRRH